MARHAINRMFILVVDFARHHNVAHRRFVHGLAIIGQIARHVTEVATDAERLVVAIHQTGYLTLRNALESLDVFKELLGRLVLRLRACPHKLTGHHETK